jgi:hypothetical protein
MQEMFKMGTVSFLANFKSINPAYIKRACSANQSACFHPIKNVYRGKIVLLLCHLSDCQIVFNNCEEFVFFFNFTS